MAAFRETNAAFHLFPIEATGNATMIETYRRLQVQEYMAQALTPSVELAADIAQDHRDMVDAFERGDIDAARTAIVAHTEHAKATMRAGIEKAGAGVTVGDRGVRGDPRRAASTARSLVVTGAAQGIGEAVATGLAKEGAEVALVDRSELVARGRREAGGRRGAGASRCSATWSSTRTAPG